MRKLLGGLVLLNLGLLAGLFVRDALASRNASGTMAQINGPYVAGTTISSSIINARYADIESEITDSLDRSGKGGMLAALKGTDGTVAAPAYSFTSEPGSGLYKIGAADLGLAVTGTKVLEWTTTAIFPALPLRPTGSGLVSAPAYSFNAETNSGLYRNGASDIRMAVAGADSFRFISGQALADDGLVGTPGLAFSAESSSGLYRAGASDVRMSVGGADLQRWASNFSIFLKGTHGRLDGSTVASSFGIWAAASGDTPLSTNYSFLTNGTSNTALNSPTGGTVEFDINNATVASVTGSGLNVASGGLTISSGGLKVGSSGTTIATMWKGTCTLNAGTPATCTATVPSASACSCTYQSTVNAHVIACTTSGGTTLTAVSGTAADSGVVTILCTT